jgi:hypothetical protein
MRIGLSANVPSILYSCCRPVAAQHQFGTFVQDSLSFFVAWDKMRLRFALCLWNRGIALLPAKLDREQQ